MRPRSNIADLKESILITKDVCETLMPPSLKDFIEENEWNLQIVEIFEIESKGNNFWSNIADLMEIN